MSLLQKHHKFQSPLQNVHTGCLVKIISSKLKNNRFSAKKFNVLPKGNINKQINKKQTKAEKTKYNCQTRCTI